MLRSLAIALKEAGFNRLATNHWRIYAAAAFTGFRLAHQRTEQIVLRCCKRALAGVAPDGAILDRQIIAHLDSSGGRHIPRGYSDQIDILVLTVTTGIAPNQRHEANDDLEQAFGK